MSTIVTRSGKGSPLTHNEVDANFTNLNSDKTENSSAAITGGTINGTTLGTTTPAAATFTTLTATGQTSLGGAAGSETVRVNTGTNTGKYTVFEANTANNVQLIGAANSANLGLYSTGGGLVRFYTASALQEQQFVIGRTASAVNYVQVTGAATNNRPTISAQGSDGALGLNFQWKSTANVFFQSHSGSNTQLKITGASAAVNNHVIGGGAAGITPTVSVEGSDTNISATFQSKGTGAIDLAAGSSGVNISNGGTVTAITRTNSGSGYTSVPTATITAPTTAGGVQATVTCVLSNNTASGTNIASGGTGYTLNDTLTLVGGTGTAQQLTVTGVSGGVITNITGATAGAYTVVPSNPISVTGGTGSGATFNMNWNIGSTFTITNAGSGYVEQPTVTFSGGGGSGAAAYATVGSGTVIRALGATGTQSLDFSTPASTTNTVPVLRLRDISVGTNNTGFVQIQNNNGYSSIIAQGPTNAGLFIAANGTGNIQFNTNSTNETQQLRVSHTASAVNYVQVTGAATTAKPLISAQGSDTNIDLNIQPKGSGLINIVGASRLGNNLANYFVATGGATTVAPSLAVSGSDTNIDLALTPKGTGRVKFGTHTGVADTAISGYIEIVDAGGTVRKLAVIT